MAFAPLELWREAELICASDEAAELTGASEFLRWPCIQARPTAETSNSPESRSCFLVLPAAKKAPVLRLALASAQHSPGKENDSEKNVNDVIHFAKHQQRSETEHMVGPRAQKPTADSEQQVYKTEDYAKASRRAGRSRETKIQREDAGHDMH